MAGNKHIIATLLTCGRDPQRAWALARCAVPNFIKRHSSFLNSVIAYHRYRDERRYH